MGITPILDPHEPQIRQWIASNLSNDEILIELTLLTGHKPGQRTLTRFLKRKAIPTRRQSPLDALKPRILTWAAEGQTYDDMLVNIEIITSGAQKPTLRSLERRLAEWGVRRKGVRSEAEMERVDERIMACYNANWGTDVEISEMLEREGIQITTRAVGGRRRALGLPKRIVVPKDRGTPVDE